MLLLAGEAVHGYRLHQELNARGLAMQPASMYRRLRRFEQDGWVTSRWSDPIGGPRRHIYELTPQGRAALHEITGLITATRDSYKAFEDTYEHALTRRGGAAGTDDETGSLIPGEHDPRASPERLRAHAELLAGWLLLHLEDGETHGYDLRRDVADVHRLSTDPGTVYRMLRRFEANKWVQSHWTQSVGGPRRRVYRLTPTGQRNLDKAAELIATIRDGFDAYLLAYQGSR